MAEMVYFRTAADIDRDAWNKCFPSPGQDYNALVQAENKHAGAFTNRYYCLMEGMDIVCAVPAFSATYPFRFSAWWHKIAHWFMQQKYMTVTCLGMPDTTSCVIGFAPGVDDARRKALVEQLLRFFQQAAFSEGFAVLAAKPFCMEEKGACVPAFMVAGFEEAAGIWFKTRSRLMAYFFRRALITKAVLL